MRPKPIYLAGPILGCADTECRDWREAARLHLATLHVDTLDPMRRDYRDRQYTTELSREIVEADLEDIRACSGVLVLCDRISAGTSMEVFFAAHVLKLPVVLVDKRPPEAGPLSPWLVHHAWRVTGNLREGAELLAHRVCLTDSKAWAESLSPDDLQAALDGDQHVTEYASALLDELARRYRQTHESK